MSDAEVNEAVEVHPIGSVPRDGTPVTLLLRHDGKDWWSKKPFRWNVPKNRWEGAESGFPLGSSIAVVGWTEVER